MWEGICGVQNRSRLGIDLFVKREPIRETGAEWATTNPA